jgi:NAD+ kinase
MKIILTGKHLDDISHYFDNDVFEIVETNPELIIAHGGDGTLLGTERAYPGILKFPIRDKRTAPLCPKHSYDQQIALFNEKKLHITKLPKLVGETNKFSVKGINDIFIHNLNRASAVRYQVLIDDELYANEVVGDGVGVSTIHGSTAYYRSITHSIFRTGIGLAFSNSTEVTNHLVLPESSRITIKIVRGPAIVIADNDNQEKYLLDVNDQITIHQTTEQAFILGLDVFMCQACRDLRHSRKYRL